MLLLSSTWTHRQVFTQHGLVASEHLRGGYVSTSSLSGVRGRSPGGYLGRAVVCWLARRIRSIGSIAVISLVPPEGGQHQPAVQYTSDRRLRHTVLSSPIQGGCFRPPSRSEQRLGRAGVFPSHPFVRSFHSSFLEPSFLRIFLHAHG